MNLQGNWLYVVDRLLRIDSSGYHMISLPSLYYFELPFNISLSHQSKDYIKSDLWINYKSIKLLILFRIISTSKL